MIVTAVNYEDFVTSPHRSSHMPPAYFGVGRLGKAASVALIALGLASTATPVGATAATTAAAGGQRSAATSSLGQPVEAPLRSRGVASSPITPVVREFSLDELAAQRLSRTRVQQADSTRSIAVSRPRPVTGYGVIGATWEGARPKGLNFAVRTRVAGADWSRWQRLHGGGCPCAICVAARTVNGHGPNRGGGEFRNASPGTDALAVGDVDQVQLRVASLGGTIPERLTLAVVDPQATFGAVTQGPAWQAGVDLPAAARTLSTGAVARASDPTAGPAIYTRAQWGANEKMRSGTPSYGTIRAGFVHHTVNANDYTQDEVPAIIRGIYAYHTQSLGWSDIGYNFLVDRFGRIWEGRYGGVDRPVIGAHTFGYNHTAFAMSAIGNFDVAAAPRKMIAAYGRLFAWKLGLNGISAKSTQVLEGERFPAISGHRDAGQTACPGRYLYEKLGRIRSLAAQVQARQAEPPAGTPDPIPEPIEEPVPVPEPVPSGPDRSRDLEADGYPDLLVRDAGTKELQVMTGDGGPGFAERRTVASKRGSVGPIAGVHDVTGDGRPDLLVRYKRTGISKIRPGRPNGLFGPALSTSETTRFADADLLIGVGNIVGSRRPDVLARDAKTQDFWIYPGARGGRWRAGSRILRNADRLADVSVSDMNGDRRPDLVARAGTKLVSYPGLDNGRFGKVRVIAERWGGKDLTVAGADVTGDGRPDVVARDRATGRSWIYTLEPDGSIGPRLGGWDTWHDLDRLISVGDVDGDGTAALLGRTQTGELVVLEALGTRWLQGPQGTGRLATDVNFAQIAGDWNADGNTDVLTRSATTGNVWLYPGTGGADLGPRRRIWRGHADRTGLVGTPDITGDSMPDLLARDTDGAIYVYPSDGNGGTLDRRVARSRLFATNTVVPAGYWNEDSYRDLIVRRRGNGQLYLLPGTPKGTLGRPVQLTEDFGGYDKIVGAGDFDVNGSPDLLARDRESGRLWLFSGTSAGLEQPRYVVNGMERFDMLG